MPIPVSSAARESKPFFIDSALMEAPLVATIFLMPPASDIALPTLLAPPNPRTSLAILTAFDIGTIVPAMIRVMAPAHSQAL